MKLVRLTSETELTGFDCGDNDLNKIFSAYSKRFYEVISMDHHKHGAEMSEKSLRFNLRSHDFLLPLAINTNLTPHHGNGRVKIP